MSGPENKIVERGYNDLYRVCYHLSRILLWIMHTLHALAFQKSFAGVLSCDASEYFDASDRYLSVRKLKCINIVRLCLRMHALGQH